MPKMSNEERIKKIADLERIAAEISREHNGWGNELRSIADFFRESTCAVEGCSYDELIAYTEAIGLCYRLAYILKYRKFPPPDSIAWQKEFRDIERSLAKKPVYYRK
jgi:hypothetical protein